MRRLLNSKFQIELSKTDVIEGWCVFAEQRPFILGQTVFRPDLTLSLLIFWHYMI